MAHLEALVLWMSSLMMEVEMPCLWLCCKALSHWEVVEKRHVPSDEQPGDLQSLPSVCLYFAMMQLCVPLQVEHYLNAGGAWRCSNCLVKTRWCYVATGQNNMRVRVLSCRFHCLCAVIVLLYPIHWYSASVACGYRIRSFHGLGVGQKALPQGW